MITRIWKGRTGKDGADAYERFLRETAFPDYGGVEGNHGWLLLRQDRDADVEFVFVSFWDSMDAVRRYAGPHSERPKYYPEDRAALLELPERVEHYETVDCQFAGAATGL
jgi:heme-degrading monooxygenase HmoA